MTKKKSFHWLSYLPIVTLGMGLLIGGVRFQLQAETTKSKVDKLETDTKTEIDKVKAEVKEIAKESEEDINEIKDDAKDTEKKIEVNKTQQDNIQAQVQQVSEKTDKIYDILIELKNKKK